VGWQVSCRAEAVCAHAHCTGGRSVARAQSLQAGHLTSLCDHYAPVDSLLFGAEAEPVKRIELLCSMQAVNSSCPAAPAQWDEYCYAVLGCYAVSGTMREASSAGFRKIANFIFGKSSVGSDSSSNLLRIKVTASATCHSPGQVHTACAVVLYWLTARNASRPRQKARTTWRCVVTVLCCVFRQQQACRCSIRQQQGRGHCHDQPCAHGDSGRRKDKGRGNSHDVSALGLCWSHGGSRQGPNVSMYTATTGNGEASNICAMCVCNKAIRLRHLGYGEQGLYALCAHRQQACHTWSASSSRSASTSAGLNAHGKVELSACLRFCIQAHAHPHP
jgi:hypothetical protein